MNIVANEMLSAILQVIFIGGVPLMLYTAWHKLRHKRSLREIRTRAGLVVGDASMLRYAIGFAILSTLVSIFFPPPMEFLTEAEGSPHLKMVGLGWASDAWAIAVAYGVIKTGLTEELLFRGLLTGSLQRRMSMWVANLLQTLIFFVPHLLMVIYLAPDLWGILPRLVIGSLVMGWIRMKSGSILGPWIIHAAANTTIAMVVATQ